jgi:hypothetical protein
MKPTQEEFNTAITKIEANHALKMTAQVNDFSAFFVAVDKRGLVMSNVFRLTWGKISRLANLPPLSQPLPSEEERHA